MRTIEQIIKTIDSEREVFLIEPTCVVDVYYNPDSSAGGQFVYNYLNYGLILDAAERSRGKPEDFFQILWGECYQESVDIDMDPETVAEAAEVFMQDADLEGCSEETMKKLVELAKKVKADNGENVTE